MTPAAPAGPPRRLVALLADDGQFGRSLAAIVLVATWVATWRPQEDPDFGWHLRIGSGVLGGAGLPHVEPFSWLTAGGPFVAHSWAWDVALAIAYRTGGLMATSLLTLPLAAAVIALTWHLTRVTAPALPPFPRSTLVALGIVIGLPVWSPRAQVWDVVFVLALAALWSAWLRRGDRRALVVVPFIPFLWVNLHGGSALALMACLLALVVAIPVGNRWGTWPRRPIRPLAISTVVALLAFAINPYGLGMLGVAGNADVGNAFLPSIAEWQPPDFGAVGFLSLRVALAALALVAFALRGRGRDPFALLLAAGWTFLALGAARFSILAGPLIVVALAPAAVGACRSWLGLSGTGAGSDQRDATPAFVPIAAGALAIVLVAAGLLQISPARQDARQTASFPVAAVAAMEASGCRGRLLNAYDWGGHLIGTTDRPVGTYGSSPRDLVADQVALEQLRMDPRPFLDGHAVELVLMPTGGPLDRWLDEVDGWERRYRDAQATVHARVGSTTCPAVTAAR